MQLIIRRIFSGENDRLGSWYIFLVSEEIDKEAQEIEVSDGFGSSNCILEHYLFKNSSAHYKFFDAREVDCFIHGWEAAKKFLPNHIAGETS